MAVSGRDAYERIAASPPMRTAAFTGTPAGNGDIRNYCLN
jgi:hypothetical protein